MRYWVTSILPAAGELGSGVKFSRAQNERLINGWLKFPIPVTMEWGAGLPIGECTEAKLEDDGSMSGLVVIPEALQPGQRIGIAMIVGAYGVGKVPAGADVADDEKVIGGIQFLTVTTRPNPCSDTQTYTEVI